jgi:hypothetical protein
LLNSVVMIEDLKIPQGRNPRGVCCLYQNYLSATRYRLRIEVLNNYYEKNFF